MGDSGFVVTNKGICVHRNSTRYCQRNIRPKGKAVIHEKVIIRADLAVINIGRYSSIGPECVLRPAYKLVKGELKFFSMSIGDNVVIERGTVVEASAIGSNVHIGKNCVISKRCIIKDCCYIADGTVLPPGTIVAPFSKIAGCPGRLVSELPESAPETFRLVALEHYLSANEEKVARKGPDSQKSETSDESRKNIAAGKESERGSEDDSQM